MTTVLGVPLHLQRSWWAVPVLIALAARWQGFVGLGLFLLLGPMTVLIHELGHLLMARHHGIRADRLELGLFEGRVWLPEAASRRVRATILIAGPLAHAAWGVLLLLGSLAGGLHPEAGSIASWTRGGAILVLLWSLGNLRPIGESDGAQLLALALANDPSGRWRVPFVSGMGVVVLAGGGYLLTLPGLGFVGGLFVLAGVLAQVGAWGLWRER